MVERGSQAMSPCCLSFRASQRWQVCLFGGPISHPLALTPELRKYLPRVSSPGLDSTFGVPQSLLLDYLAWILLIWIQPDPYILGNDETKPPGQHR